MILRRTILPLTTLALLGHGHSTGRKPVLTPVEVSGFVNPGEVPYLLKLGWEATYLWPNLGEASRPKYPAATWLHPHLSPTPCESRGGPLWGSVLLLL